MASSIFCIHPDEQASIEIANSHKPGDEHNGDLEGKIFLRLRLAYWRGYADARAKLSDANLSQTQEGK